MASGGTESTLEPVDTGCTTNNSTPSKRRVTMDTLSTRVLLRSRAVRELPMNLKRTTTIVRRWRRRSARGSPAPRRRTAGSREADRSTAARDRSFAAPSSRAKSRACRNVCVRPRRRASRDATCSRSAPRRAREPQPRRSRRQRALAGSGAVDARPAVVEARRHRGGYRGRRPVRTAIISGEGQLYMVKEGEAVTPRYRVAKISADVVELVDLFDNSVDGSRSDRAGPRRSVIAPLIPSRDSTSSCPSPSSSIPISGGVRRACRAGPRRARARRRRCSAANRRTCSSPKRWATRASSRRPPSRSGARLVMAWGGDGTINEVASALAFSDVPLGIIPAGSGNGLARELGVDPRPGVAIAEALARRAARRSTSGRSRAGCSSTSPASASTRTSRRGSAVARRRGFLGYVGLTAQRARHLQPDDATASRPEARASTRAPSSSRSPTPRSSATARASRPARASTMGCWISWWWRSGARLATLCQLPRLFNGTVERMRGCTIRRIRERDDRSRPADDVSRRRRAGRRRDAPRRARASGGAAGRGR